MNTVIIIISIIVLIAFATLGVFFLKGKGINIVFGLIYRYRIRNDERAEYDEKSLLDYMAKFMFSLSFCSLLWIVGEITSIKFIYELGLWLFFAIIILIRVRKLDRFKKMETYE